MLVIFGACAPNFSHNEQYHSFQVSIVWFVHNWYETFYRNVLILAILDDDDDDAAILHSLNRQCCLRCMFIFDLTLVDRSRQARR